MIQLRDSLVEPKALNFERGRFGTCVNGQTFQVDAVASFGGWQYATYFDGRRCLGVARRPLPDGPWQRFAFDDHTIDHTDAHNVPVLGICPADGTIHLAFDHHNSALHYRVSRAGTATTPDRVTWSSELFTGTTSELVAGEPLEGVTYPGFFRTPDGVLRLSYRIGRSGDGDSHLAEYDPDGGRWSVLGAFISGKGDYAGSSSRSAYHNGFDSDHDGRVHTTWVWREGLDNAEWGLLNCHDLQYAQSADGGRTWHNDDGGRIGVTGSDPIRLGSAGVTVQPLPWRWGIMNQVTQTVDTAGRVHVVLWLQPVHAPTASADLGSWRYVHFWRDGEGSWHQRQLPEVGRKPSVVADDNDDLVLVFTKPESPEYHGFDPGGPLYVLRASAAQGWGDWQVVYRSQRAFVGEPRIDKYRWQQERVLSVYAQEAPDRPGDPSALHVLDLAEPRLRW